MEVAQRPIPNGHAGPAPARLGKKHVRTPWYEIAAHKRASDLAKIPREWAVPSSVVEEARLQRSLVGAYIEGLLDAETRRITSMDVADLLRHMGSGDLTAVQVVTAFCKRAALAHQLVRS